MRFKTVRLTTIRNQPKRTISTSGGLRLLQMVSEPDTERCASEDASPQRGWIGLLQMVSEPGCASEDASPQRG